MCKEGRLDEADGVVELMNKRGCKFNSHVCNVLIDGFVKHSKLDSAVKVFREMSGKGCSLTVVSYNILINGLLRAGRFREAYDCVNDDYENRRWKLYIRG